MPYEEIKQKRNQHRLRWFFNSEDRSWSAAVRMSDNIITAIFKQRLQKQYVPGLSNAAESIVDSEMLILLVYFLLMFIFSLYSCVWEYLLLKRNIVFHFGKEIKSFFSVLWQQTQSPLVKAQFI